MSSMSSSPPPSRLRQVAPWVCVAGVLAYVLVAPVLFTATGASSTWPAWLVGIAAVGLAVAAALIAARSSRDDLASHEDLVLAHRRAEERAEAASRALDALANEQLPAFLDSEPAPPLPHLPGDAGAQARLDEAAAMLSRVQEERVARRDAVQVAVVALSRKVQAAAHRIQEEAARMVQRHPTDPDILQTSMRVDHAAAQQARQAQSLAALCGEWPGQQWSEPLPLPDVVKGAASRITAFHRVEVSGDPGVAVSARIVEPLIHLVAELLSNATQSSPPTTQVLVSLRQVQRGAVVEIDDCGVGLDLKQLEQARDIASGKREISITELGEIPQTGLAVVGTYARRHGFRVDVTESVYGGLRAIVMIPAELTEAVVPSGMLTPAATHAERRLPHQRGLRARVPSQRHRSRRGAARDRAAQRQARGRRRVARTRGARPGDRGSRRAAERARRRGRRRGGDARGRCPGAGPGRAAPASWASPPRGRRVPRAVCAPATAIAPWRGGSD